MAQHKSSNNGVYSTSRRRILLRISLYGFGSRACGPVIVGGDRLPRVRILLRLKRATTGAHEMPHLMLTSALLFALLAVVAIAIGACLGIAPRSDAGRGRTRAPKANLRLRPPPAVGQIGLAEDFGIGLRHATNFAPDPGRSFSGSGSLHA